MELTDQRHAAYSILKSNIVEQENQEAYKGSSTPSKTPTHSLQHTPAQSQLLNVRDSTLCDIEKKAKDFHVLFEIRRCSDGVHIVLDRLSHTAENLNQHPSRLTETMNWQGRKSKNGLLDLPKLHRVHFRGFLRPCALFEFRLEHVVGHVRQAAI